MSKFIGRLVNVGIAKESVRGTGVDPAYWLPKMEFEHDDKVQQVVNESSYGIIEDSEGADVTEKFSEGTLKGRVEVNSFPLWLLAGLGTDTPTLVEAGVYDHAFSIAESAQHQSLTLSVKDPNAGVGLRYALTMLDSLEFNAELNKYIEYTASFRGNKNASDAVTPVYSEDKFFLPQHGVFKHASDIAGLAAASAVSIKRFNFTMSKNIEDDQVLGSVDAYDRLNKQFAIEGTVELLYEDRTFIDTYLLGDVARALEIKLTNPATIGATSNPTITFQFAKVKFSEVARAQDNDDFVRQTLSFKAFYSLSDAKMLNAIVRNTIASY